MVGLARAEIRPSHLPEREESGWVENLTGKIQTYRKLYEDSRRAYESARETYLAGQRMLISLRESIALMEENATSWERFRERERRAWQRLYGLDGEEKKDLQPMEPFVTGSSLADLPGVVYPPEEISREGNFLVRLMQRYRFYRDAYSAYQEALEHLQSATDALSEELEQARQELDRTRRVEGEQQVLREREREAWQRLYRE